MLWLFIIHVYKWLNSVKMLFQDCINIKSTEMLVACQLFEVLMRSATAKKLDHPDVVYCHS